jgi:hypothetical protein
MWLEERSSSINVSYTKHAVFIQKAKHKFPFTLHPMLSCEVVNKQKLNPGALFICDDLKYYRCFNANI